MLIFIPHYITVSVFKFFVCFLSKAKTIQYPTNKVLMDIFLGSRIKLLKCLSIVNIVFKKQIFCRVYFEVTILSFEFPLSFY